MLLDMIDNADFFSKMREDLLIYSNFDAIATKIDRDGYFQLFFNDFKLIFEKEFTFAHQELSKMKANHRALNLIETLKNNLLIFKENFKIVVSMSLDRLYSRLVEARQLELLSNRLKYQKDEVIIECLEESAISDRRSKFSDNFSLENRGSTFAFADFQDSFVKIPSLPLNTAEGLSPLHKRPSEPEQKTFTFPPSRTDETPSPILKVTTEFEKDQKNEDEDRSHQDDKDQQKARRSFFSPQTDIDLSGHDEDVPLRSADEPTTPITPQVHLENIMEVIPLNFGDPKSVLKIRPTSPKYNSPSSPSFLKTKRNPLLLSPAVAAVTRALGLSLQRNTDPNDQNFRPSIKQDLTERIRQINLRRQRSIGEKISSGNSQKTKQFKIDGYFSEMKKRVEKFEVLLPKSKTKKCEKELHPHFSSPSTIDDPLANKLN